jgi:hypothetical protein
MSWIHINDQRPDDGREVFYFFAFLGVYRGKYMQSEYPQELFEEGTEPVYGDCFYGDKGFLTDDVTHWMPDDGREDLPDVPEGYIKIHDGKFSEWALKEETVRIKKDEYEHLKWQVNYYDAGHLMGMVCPDDDCPCHVYFEEEANGYKCGGCGNVYTDVKENRPKYTSRFDRPCPHCNPHDEDTKEFYQNGFLEYTAGAEPHSTEHFICNKCDSTYNIGEI